MSELTDLYQQVILDHNRRPRNYGKLEHANRQAEGFNPVCGDHLTLYLKLNGDVIDDLRFEGEGCAISKASASIFTPSPVTSCSARRASGCCGESASTSRRCRRTRAAGT